MTSEEEIALRKAKALEAFRSRSRASGHSMILAATEAIVGEKGAIPSPDLAENGGVLGHRASDLGGVVLNGGDEAAGDGVVSRPPPQQSLDQSGHHDAGHVDAGVILLDLLAGGADFIVFAHAGAIYVYRFDTGEWQHLKGGSLP